MPKMLKFGVNTLSVFLYLTLLGLVVSLVQPIGYLIDGFGSNVAKDIVTNSDYLVILHHTNVSTAAIAQFPSQIYGVLMAIGTGLGTISGLMMVWAGLQILNNVVKKRYFSSENVTQFKRIVVAQFVVLVADLLIASGNQLIRTDLYRVNSALPVDWSDPLQDLLMLVIIGIVYFVYQRATALKQEAELTI